MQTWNAYDKVCHAKPPVTYEIRKGQRAPCELWSIVPTNFGGDAENFVCEGTYNYCAMIMEQLDTTTTPR